MAYLNKIDINGRTYYLQHLTDGKNEAMLPTPVKDDQLLLRSQVVNSVTSKESQSGSRVPLSAYQGYSLNVKLNNEILDREADVDEEKARAEGAEKVLTDNLAKEIQDRTDDVNAEKTRALAAEKVLTDNLAQEIADRTSAITTEKNRAITKENELDTALKTESARAKAAEEANAKAVTDESDRAKGVESTLDAAIKQEATDRATAFSTEESRAKNAEGALDTAIKAEKTRAEGVESGLDSRIVTIETFFKAAEIDKDEQNFIDTLKEIQTYIANDTTGAAAMSASIGANKTAIETEATTARAAEKANADAIAKKLDKADAYAHPSHTAYDSGLYKITVDEFGHVSSVATVTKEDIVGLGIPAQDTTYDDTIASLQEQIDALKALVESYHPVTEPEPEPEEIE